MVLEEKNENFTLTRVPNFIDLLLDPTTYKLMLILNILGTTGSRCVHVANASGKLVKKGLLHVSTFRSIGVIDRDYQFEFIINNLNQPPFTVTFPGGGTLRSLTQDIEDLNYFS